MVQHLDVSTSLQFPAFNPIRNRFAFCASIRAMGLVGSIYSPFEIVLVQLSAWTVCFGVGCCNVQSKARRNEADVGE